MNAQKLRDEFEKMLVDGFEALRNQRRAEKGVGYDWFTVGQVRALLRERAANLAQAYADRIQDEPDELLHGPLDGAS